MSEYNTTQLNPDITFERHVFHRDQFAHYLRWSHVLKIARQRRAKMNVLDVGCGSGNLFEVMYRNRLLPKKYLGLDIRKQTIKNNEKKFPQASWKAVDLVKPYSTQGQIWDLITSFEVVEHVGKRNVDKFLRNIWAQCNDNTTILISTPCYDPKVGAAKNHIYDGGPQELTFKELQKKLSKYFEIKNVYGTFASIKDYKPYLTKNQLLMFNQLHQYYDAEMMSVIFAPLFPEHSRNCLWVLKRSKSQKINKK